MGTNRGEGHDDGAGGGASCWGMGLGGLTLYSRGSLPNLSSASAWP